MWICRNNPFSKYGCCCCCCCCCSCYCSVVFLSWLLLAFSLWPRKHKWKVRKRGKVRNKTQEVHLCEGTTVQQSTSNVIHKSRNVSSVCVIPRLGHQTSCTKSYFHARKPFVNVSQGGCLKYRASRKTTSSNCARWYNTMKRPQKKDKGAKMPRKQILPLIQASFSWHL